MTCVDGKFRSKLLILEDEAMRVEAGGAVFALLDQERGSKHHGYVFGGVGESDVSQKPLVYLVGQEGLHNLLLAEHINSSLACNCNSITIEKLEAYVRKNAPALLLVDTCSTGFELESLYFVQGLSALAQQKVFSALINIPLGMNVEPYLRIDGLVGIFREDASPEQLIRGIDAMLSGEYWFPRVALHRYLDRTRKQYSRPFESQQVDLLTEKELAVLKALGEGASNEAIATKLYVSKHTVKTHIYNLYRKLGVSNRVEAAMWARQNVFKDY